MSLIKDAVHNRVNSKNVMYSCPGWLSVERSCFKIESTRGMDWHDAEDVNKIVFVAFSF